MGMVNSEYQSDTNEAMGRRGEICYTRGPCFQVYPYLWSSWLCWLKMKTYPLRQDLTLTLLAIKMDGFLMNATVPIWSGLLCSLRNATTAMRCLLGTFAQEVHSAPAASLLFEKLQAHSFSPQLHSVAQEWAALLGQTMPKWFAILLLFRESLAW